MILIQIYTLTILYAVLKITKSIPEPKQPIAISVSGMLGLFFVVTTTAGVDFISSKTTSIPLIF